MRIRHTGHNIARKFYLHGHHRGQKNPYRKNLSRIELENGKEDTLYLRKLIKKKKNVSITFSKLSVFLLSRLLH